MFVRPSFPKSLCVLTALAALGLAACSADDAADAGQEGATRGASVVATFDAARGELPEGLAIRAGTAYVGFAPLGEIVAIDLATQQRSPYATLPKPVPNKGFMTGLHAQESGALYAALASFDPAVTPGVYVVPAGGGPAKLFAQHPDLTFPNGFAEDAALGILVTDSASGSIFQLGNDGSARVWLHDTLFVGDKDHCGVGVGASFDIGVNGIAIRGREVVVANSDKATLIAIPILEGGAAGAPRVLAAENCAWLGGADGVTVDASGDVIVASNRLDRVVRVTAAGAVSAVSTGAPLDFPATVVSVARGLFVTSFALTNASTGKPAHPALIRL